MNYCRERGSYDWESVFVDRVYDDVYRSWSDEVCHRNNRRRAICSSAVEVGRVVPSACPHRQFHAEETCVLIRSVPPASRHLVHSTVQHLQCVIRNKTVDTVSRGSDSTNNSFHVIYAETGNSLTKLNILCNQHHSQHGSAELL